jgi:hypothetical protein
VTNLIIVRILFCGFCSCFLYDRSCCLCDRSFVLRVVFIFIVLEYIFRLRHKKQIKSKPRDYLIIVRLLFCGFCNFFLYDRSCCLCDRSFVLRVVFVFIVLA